MAKNNYDNYKYLVREIEVAIGLRNQLSRFFQLPATDGLCSIKILRGQYDDLNRLIKKLLETDGILQKIAENQELLNQTVEYYSSKGNQPFRLGVRDIKIKYSPALYRERLRFITSSIGITLNQIYLEEHFLKDQPCIKPTKIPIRSKEPTRINKINLIDELYN